MGQTALLPLRRKACWGFFSPWKIRRLRSGLNPRTWVPEVSTLPVDHRSRLCSELHFVSIFPIIMSVFYCTDVWELHRWNCTCNYKYARTLILCAEFQLTIVQTKSCRSCSHHVKGCTDLVYIACCICCPSGSALILALVFIAAVLVNEEMSCIPYLSLKGRDIPFPVLVS